MTKEPSTRRSRRTSFLVALIGLLLPAVGVSRSLKEAAWDVSLFAAFGEDAGPTTEYAENLLGDVHLRRFEGHDGKFFFVQANDPWLLHPEENAAVLDRPLYRSQRMLYPLIAGGAGLFGPEVILWSMLIVNLLAMGAGTWVVAQVAEQMGGSAWWGLAFALNPGFLSEVNIGGAGVVAGVAAFGAVLLLMREKASWAVTMLVVAALAREAMLLAAAGCAAWLWINRRRRSALWTIGAPTIAVALWALYVRARVGEGDVTAQVQEIGMPFVGFAEAFVHWLEDPLDLLVGGAIMFLLLAYARRVLIRRHLVGVAFVGFVVLGIVFTEQVWRSYFDITRAIAPTITSFVLLVDLSNRPAPSKTKASRI